MTVTYTPTKSAIRDQLHGKLLRLGGLASVQARRGSPEGVVPGTRGDLVMDTDTATLYVKSTGEPGGALSREGWIAIGSGVVEPDTVVSALADAGTTTGATDTAVMLFSGSEVTGEGITVVDGPQTGTLIRVTTPGVYLASFGGIIFNGAGVADAAYGVSVGQLANLANDPSFGTPGVELVLASSTPLGVQQAITFATPIVISSQAAVTPNANLVRFLCTNANDGPPPLVPGSAWYRLVKVA